MLIRGEHVTFFVPFAARWPLEVHMLPHRHVADLAETTPEERDEIAREYRRAEKNTTSAGVASALVGVPPGVTSWPTTTAGSVAELR